MVMRMVLVMQLAVIERQAMQLVCSLSHPASARVSFPLVHAGS